MKILRRINHRYHRFMMNDSTVYKRTSEFSLHL